MSVVDIPMIYVIYALAILVVGVLTSLTFREPQPDDVTKADDTNAETSPLLKTKEETVTKAEDETLTVRSRVIMCSIWFMPGILLGAMRTVSNLLLVRNNTSSLYTYTRIRLQD